eukprot:scpid65397/ scgid26983/ 
MAEDHQTIEHDSADYGLDTVLFDVWDSTILPMLTIPDIFHLCGVSRKVRRLLFNEWTFKRLCKCRYQLSPCLNVPYVQAAKCLYLATSIATLHVTTSEFTRNCIADGNYDLVLSQKNRMMVLLLSLSLKPYARSSNPTALARLSSVIGKSCRSVDAWCALVPKLSPKVIHDNCTASTKQDEFGMNTYFLEDVINLLFETCGSSIEEFQTAIIKYIENDISELSSYLPYLNRSWRLVEIGKGHYTVLKSYPQRMSIWGDRDQARLRQGWTYNPYNLTNSHDSSNPDACMFINFVEDHLANHSVIRLMIMGSLSTSYAEDYFRAYLEYYMIFICLPASTRPSHDDLFRGLGDYLLLASAESHAKKKWTRSELLHAMIQYGSEPDCNATRPIHVTGRGFLRRILSMLRNLLRIRVN